MGGASLRALSVLGNTSVRGGLGVNRGDLDRVSSLGSLGSLNLSVYRGNGSNRSSGRVANLVTGGEGGSDGIVAVNSGSDSLVTIGSGGGSGRSGSVAGLVTGGDGSGHLLLGLGGSRDGSNRGSGLGRVALLVTNSGDSGGQRS